jgi:tetratricopeptide (TPR) repeat protein
VSESLKQQIDRLEELYKSELDPRGRAFVPLADAHRRLGDLDQALTVIQEGLGTHPDFASAHLVRGWVHRSRQEPEDAMRSFERVLALDAENSFARDAIAELIDDQRAQAYGDEVAAGAPDAPAAAEGERPVVPIASLAPVDTVAASDAAPESAHDDARAVVPIASLAPEAPVETVVPIASLAPEAPADTVVAPDAVDGRPVVPIASLAPGASVDSVAASDAAPESAPDDARAVVPIASLAPEDVEGDVVGERDVVPIPSLAPEGGAGEAIQAPHDEGLIDAEIYTQTLAELYAVQGATNEAIEVYGKLIADDPDNEALRTRLNALESLDSGAEGSPAQLDIRAGLGALGIGAGRRQTVSIESLAPDGNG